MNWRLFGNSISNFVIKSYFIDYLLNAEKIDYPECLILNNILSEWFYYDYILLTLLLNE